MRKLLGNRKKLLAALLPIFVFLPLLFSAAFGKAQCPDQDTVTSITPNTLIVGQTVNVAIAGNDFNGPGCYFPSEFAWIEAHNGDILAFLSNISVVSATQITATVTLDPGIPAQLACIVVTPPIGEVAQPTTTMNPCSLSEAEWGIGSAPVQIVDILIVANIGGGQDETAPVSNSPTATFPLGSNFTIALADPTGSAIAADYQLSSPSVAGDVQQNALFPNSVVFQYSNLVSNRGSFHAAHVGNVTLTITPMDAQSGGGPVSVNIVVTNPASLGSSHPEVDELIYPIANATGIPPDFIKAQMAQESGSKFNPMAYRYEPLAGGVGDLGAVSRGQDLRTSAFASYRFATIEDSSDPALTQGVSVDSDDLGTVDHFPCCGSTPTALQIVASYDSVQHWCRFKGYPNESQCLKLLKNNDFTAQTSLAASFGYMQLTYVTAIQTMHWQGADGLLNPTLLFDTAANLQSGGGSLTVANRYLDTLYANANPQQTADPDLQFSDTNHFVESFRAAWRRYNGSGSYPDQVIARIPAYAVVAAGSIF